MTEKEKMLAGEVYSAIDPQLLEELKVAREKIYEYNALRPSETDKMKEIIKDLFGHVVPISILQFLTKPPSPLATTASSVQMSVSILLAIVLTRLSATAGKNGQSLSPLAITCGLEAV